MSSAHDPKAPAATAHLQEAPLRGLIAANATSAVRAVGRAGHFTVEIHIGDGVAHLTNAHDEVRAFASLSTLAGYLAKLGCKTFQVDMTSFVPGRLRAARPERSAAMKLGKLPKAASKSRPARKT